MSVLAFSFSSFAAFFGHFHADINIPTQPFFHALHGLLSAFGR